MVSPFNNFLTRNGAQSARHLSTQRPEVPQAADAQRSSGPHKLLAKLRLKMSGNSAVPRRSSGAGVGQSVASSRSAMIELKEIPPRQESISSRRLREGIQDRGGSVQLPPLELGSDFNVESLNRSLEERNAFSSQPTGSDQQRSRHSSQARTTSLRRKDATQEEQRLSSRRTGIDLGRSSRPSSSDVQHPGAEPRQHKDENWKEFNIRFDKNVAKSKRAALASKLKLRRTETTSPETYVPSVGGHKAIHPDIKQALKGFGDSYLAYGHNPEHSHHVLLGYNNKGKGRLISLHSLSGGVLALSESKRDNEWRDVFSNDKSDNIPEIKVSEGAAQLDTKSVLLPDKTIQNYLFGNAENADTGETFRLHEGKLYKTAPNTDEWNEVQASDLPEANNGKLSQLVSHSSGMMTLIKNDNTLTRLDKLKKDGFPTFDLGKLGIKKVSTVSYNKDDDALILGTDDKDQQKLFFAPANEGLANAQLLPIKDIHLSTVYLHDNWMLGADLDGKLCIGPDSNDGASQLHQHLEKKITSVVKGDYKIKAFLPAESKAGKDIVHAIVEDEQKQTHAVTVNVTSESPEADAAWNVSTALVRANGKGLPSSTDTVNPDLAHQVYLGKEDGRLALYDGKIYHKNDGGSKWHPSNIEAQQLFGGQDGKAWIYKDGKYTSLKIEPEKIPFGDNHLPLVPGKGAVAEDKPLPGLEDENKDIKDVGILKSGHYLTLGKDDDIHFYQRDSDNGVDKKGVITLPKETLKEEIKKLSSSSTARSSIDSSQQPDSNIKLSNIALGAGGTPPIFIRTDKNQLFSLPHESWSKGSVSGLKKENITGNSDSTAPEQQVITLHSGGKEGLVVKSGKDEYFKFMDTAGAGSSHWKKLDTGNKTESDETRKTPASNPLFDTTRRGYDTPFGKLKADYNILGQTIPKKASKGQETRSFMQRVGKNIADNGKPVLQPLRDSPQAVKAMEHAVRGRDGLSSLYDEMAVTFRQFDTLEVDNNRTVTTGNGDINERLDTLLKREDCPEWIKDVKILNDEVGRQAYHDARTLSVLYPKPEGNYRRSTAKVERGIGHMNPARNSDSDGLLTNKLLTMFNNNPSHKADNNGLSTAAILEKMKDDGIKLSFPKGNIPLGQRRDRGDDADILKAALIQKAFLLEKINNFVNEIEEQLPHNGQPSIASSHTRASDHQVHKKELAEEWSDFLAKEVEPSKVLKASGKGFINTRGREAIYDSWKTMGQSISDPWDRSNLVLRRILDVDYGPKNDTKDIKNELKEQLTKLPEGNTFSLARGYNANAAANMLPDLDADLFHVGVIARLSLARGYKLEFEKDKENGGTKVSFERMGSVSGTAMGSAGVGKSHGVLPGPPGGTSPSIWAGVGGGPTVTGSRKYISSFTLKDKDLASFIDMLVDGADKEAGTGGYGSNKRGRGEIPLASYEEKAANHSVKYVSELNASIDAFAGVMGTVPIPMADINTSADTYAEPRARIAVRAFVSENLATWRSLRDEKFSPDGIESKKNHNNNLSFFNGGQAMVDIPVSVGGREKHPEIAFNTLAGPSAGGLSASLDRGKKRNFKQSQTHAKPVSKDDVDKMVKALDEAFKDNETIAKEVNNIKDNLKTPSRTADLVMDQMRNLTDLFKDESAYGQRWNRSDQLGNTKIKALEKLDELFFQQAEALNSQMLRSAEQTIEKSNARSVMQAKYVQQVADADPSLNGLIQKIKKEPGTSATITLELSSKGKQTLNKLKEELGQEAAEIYMEYKLGGDEKPLKRYYEQALKKQTSATAARIEKFDDIIKKDGGSESHVRLKSIAFDQVSDNKSEFSTPKMLPGVGISAAASLSRSLGKIEFSYNDQSKQDLPVDYKLTGELNNERINLANETDKRLDEYNIVGKSSGNGAAAKSSGNGTSGQSGSLTNNASRRPSINRTTSGSGSLTNNTAGRSATNATSGQTGPSTNTTPGRPANNRTSGQTGPSTNTTPGRPANNRTSGQTGPSTNTTASRPATNATSSPSGSLANTTAGRRATNATSGQSGPSTNNATGSTPASQSDPKRMKRLCQEISAQSNNKKTDCYYCSLAFVYGRAQDKLPQTIKDMRASLDPDSDGLEPWNVPKLWDNAFGDNWRSVTRDTGGKRLEVDGEEYFYDPYNESRLSENFESIKVNNRFAFSYETEDHKAHNIAGFKDQSGNITLFDPQYNKVISSEQIIDHMKSEKVSIFSIMEPNLT